MWFAFSKKLILLNVKVPHLYSHLGHKDRSEDVVGQCQEDPLLKNK